jgi:hypothetical protein
MVNSYNQGGSGGGMVILLVVTTLIIGLIIFTFFGSSINATKSLHNRLFGDRVQFSTPQIPSRQVDIQLVLPPKENEYCKIQEIMVPEDQESHSRDRVLGWDSQNDCCVRQLEGYNCALGRQSVLTYCHTSLIGGVVKYVQVDGYYSEVSSLSEFMDDLDKTRIENKNCVSQLKKYPQEVKPIQ